jgi:hypothetical protein
LASFDGAIFLITKTEEKETYCHDIYVVNPETAKFLLKVASQMGQLGPGIKEMQLKPWMKVEFEQNKTTLTNDSKLSLKRTWNAYQLETSNQLEGGIGFFETQSDTSLETITQQQSKAILVELGGDTINPEVKGASDIQEVSGCQGVTLLVVVSSNTTNILMIVGGWDGFHRGFADRPFAREELSNFQPKDSTRFGENLKKILDAKPVAITVAVSEEGLIENAEQILRMITSQSEQTGYTAIRQGKTATILPDEIRGLERIGLTYTDFDAIVFFSTNPYPLD